MIKRFIQSVFIVFLLNSCSGSGGSSSAAPAGLQISLDFNRVASGVLNPFTVTAMISDNGALVTGVASEVQVTLGRGAGTAVTETADGFYQFTVTPDQTGEHDVTVAYKTASIKRTALVFSDVHADWGQPMSVSGLVNTEGYEDGVTITPDGEYLFVQYGPIYFSALILFPTSRAAGGCEGNRLEFPVGTPNRCTHEWIDTTIGPVSAPERPGFFGARFSGMTLLHNSMLYNLATEEAPIYAAATMFYGFKKQSDGSFAEPFYLAFEDENDAIINSFGLSFLQRANGTTTITFTFDDATDPDMVDLSASGKGMQQSYFDVYTTDITLGSNTSLGMFLPNPSGIAGDTPIRGTDFPSTLVNFGKIGANGIAGTQGNSHIFAVNDVIQSIWTDDEFDTDVMNLYQTVGDLGELSAYVLTSGIFPNGTWTKVVLPTVINKVIPDEESQPFFEGDGLYYTHNSDTIQPEILYSAYSPPCLCLSIY